MVRLVYGCSLLPATAIKVLTEPSSKMTEDIVRSQIEAFEELLDKNLKIVQKALGIEAIISVEALPEQGDQKSQLELTNKEVINNAIDNKNSKEKLSENKHYLATKNIEMKAMFAQSRAKFIARQQAKKYSQQ